MNPEPSGRDDVDSLVRDYLLGQERAEDAGRILAGVRARMAEASAKKGGARAPSSRAIRTAARWVAGVAATVLIAGFAWTSRQATARADAVKLVREAREALGATPADRAYQIRIDLAPGMAERSPFLAAVVTFDCRLWARSDQFWVECRRGSQAWAWGRDERRHVWVAPSPDLGLDFSPEDLPEPLDEALDLFHFDLDAILQRLSTDFDVTLLAPAPSVPPGLTTIRGTPRADHPRPRLRSVTLAIDERTKLVHKVVLSRVRDERPIAEVSFTFDRAEAQADAAYRPATHLEPNAPIYGPDRRLWRHRELVRFLGSLLLKANARQDGTPEARRPNAPGFRASSPAFGRAIDPRRPISEADRSRSARRKRPDQPDFRPEGRT